MRPRIGSSPLTGPGGIGKTRLALEIAHILLPEYQGDVWFVELAPVPDGSLIAVTVASVLGLQLGGNAISPEALARAIGSRRLLLVIDNCEHVIDAAAKFVETVLRLCPATHVLATSRELMRIGGEWAYTSFRHLMFPRKICRSLARTSSWTAALSSFLLPG